MANTIKVKQSSVAGKVPTTAQLSLGELAVNTYDGKLFLKKSVSGVETIIDVTAGADADILAIAAISDSSTGFLKKTAANTWSVDPAISATTGTFSGVLSPNGGIANGATFNNTGSAGEGGELHLQKGATSTLSADLVFDLYNQSIRFFENGGTNRGASLDISAQSASVGSTILTSTTSAATFPTLNQNTTGSSASCTGNAATATNVAWSGVTSKPTTRDGFGITDVPKTDGTGASGTWGISVSGSSASAGYVSNAHSAGTGLTGSNYNGSSAQTWSVTNPVSTTATTVTVYTSGSGTYTPPAGVKKIWVRCVGGGGGGGGSGAGGSSPANGGAGGTTTFGTSMMVANGGGGGPNGLNGGYLGGAGGSASGGHVNVYGDTAPNCIGNSQNGAGIGGYGGNGGGSCLGGGGNGGYNGGGAGYNGLNYGGGGGGAGGNGSSSYQATGGGGGGYCELTITNPSSYSYAVGAAGGYGGGGTAGNRGGTGAGGIIIITEFYNY